MRVFWVSRVIVLQVEVSVKERLSELGFLRKEIGGNRLNC